jgi:chemotaxis protein MotA
MSFTTMLGFLAGLGLFIGSVLLATTNIGVFLSFSSFLLVVGGTIAATFFGQEARYVLLALKGVGGIFIPHRVSRNILNQEVGRIIRWGYLVKEKGFLPLEDEIKKVSSDPFLVFGVELLITGYDGKDVRDTLQNVTDNTFERNMVQVNILRSMGGTAPAFGMIGTLIGLIVMLDTMGSDPSALGAGLAVALNTTLYGVLLARLIFVPAANKLQQRQEILRFRHDLVVEGMALLAEKRSPRFIQDRMNSFLDPSIRFNIDQQMKDR